MTAWLLEKSAAARAGAVAIREQLDERAGFVHLCPAGGLLHHGLGVVHVDRDYERIAEVRPPRVRRLQ